MGNHLVYCITPSCMNAVINYGEAYHRVCDTYLDKDKERGFTALCQNCGGLFDGKVWTHICMHCDKEVGNEDLTGFFVPHSCKPCQDEIVEYQKKMGHVCGNCRQVHANCCC